MTRVFAPGRVNLIGDHTDYSGGLVMPMAIDLGTTIEGERRGDVVRLSSDHAAADAEVPLFIDDPSEIQPPWARYPAGVVSVIHPSVGFEGSVTTTLPVGAGLSSSAALEVSVALALGFDGTPLELALACQEAEQRASGVPCGVMDQLASTAGQADHALLIDCTSLEVTPVPLPPDIEIVVVQSGEKRALAQSAYAERRASCEAAAALVGPLREVTADQVAEIDDVTLRARARHVVSENDRVRRFAEGLNAGRLEECGRLMVESHESLARDFEVSTNRLDLLVESLSATSGVFGARLTGAGFGGCVVALTQVGAISEGWHVRAVDGARVLEP